MFRQLQFHMRLEIAGAALRLIRPTGDIRHVDVPESENAFPLQRGRQLRYLAVKPQRDEVITEVEFLKGDDIASPIIFAVTVETLR